MGAAVSTEDGWLTLLSIVGAGICMFDGVEVDEVLYPMLVRQRRIVPATEGAGKFRGAPASLVEYGPLECSMRVVFSADSCINAPQGERSYFSRE